MGSSGKTEVIDAIQFQNIHEVDYASVHFSDGSAYSLLKNELYQKQDALLSLSGFLFLVINLVDGDLKIIQRT